jgi:NTE family protein
MFNRRIVYSDKELSMNRLPKLLMIVALFLFVATGCAHYPVNAPLEKADPTYGYRGRNMREPGKKVDLLLALSFSGGGTRAAAFSYGVLEELKNTDVTLDGKRTRLIDKVDAISGVSGGSFTAAYYGLFGDRIFTDFEGKFLKKNIQGDIFSAILFNPYNWGRLFSGYFDRSDLAAEYYDKHVFEGATFGDMMKRKGTMVYINATDMVHGTRVNFTQDAFDLICSDLSSFPVARACAASSAVPIVFTPISLKNYAGSCNFTIPVALEKALEERKLPNRQFDLANNILPFLDAKKKPYLHLVDGGVADNLGLRALIERVTLLGDAWKALQAGGLTDVHKFVVVIVNAETEIDTKWDRQEIIPAFAAMLESYSSIAISRYNIETVALMREMLPRWADEVRRGRCAPGEVITPPGSCGDFQFYVVEVKFDALKDEAERSYFKRLPTSFSLQPDEVDKLRDAAHRILAESAEFQRLLRDLE